MATKPCEYSRWSPDEIDLSTVSDRCFAFTRHPTLALMTRSAIHTEAAPPHKSQGRPAGLGWDDRQDRPNAMRWRTESPSTRARRDAAGHPTSESRAAPARSPPRPRSFSEFHNIRLPYSGHLPSARRSFPCPMANTGVCAQECNLLTPAGVAFPLRCFCQMSRATITDPGWHRATKLASLINSFSVLRVWSACGAFARVSKAAFPQLKHLRSVPSKSPDKQ